MIQTKRNVINNNTGKRNAPVSLNTTQSVPVRVTSINGYDSTHFVNLPLDGYQDSSSLDVTQASTPESSGYGTLELSNTLTNFQNGNSSLPNCETLNAQSQKKRGRPKNQVPNQSKKPRKIVLPKTQISVENPKKKKKTNKNSKENIQTVTPRDESQEENFVMNNESFLACLDMPLINEEAPTDKSHEFYSSAGQILQKGSVVSMNSPMKLVDPISNSIKAFNIQPPKPTTSTMSLNHNMQPFFTNCSTNENVKNLQNVNAYSARNSFSVPDGSTELLERFFIGEVGEILESEIGSSINEEHLICNKSLENTIVFSGPTECPNAAVKPYNDNLLFWDNENHYNSNKSENCIAIITSENSNTKSASSLGSINGMKTNNTNANLNISTTKHFSKIIPDPKETYNFNDGYDLQQDGLIDQSNKTPSSNVVNITNPVETHIKKNDVAKNVDIGITQSQNNDVFRNFEKNLIEDHSYSIHIRQSQCSSFNEKAIIPNELETNLTNGSVAQNTEPHNNYMSNNCLWMQSEYIQSPFTDFSENIEPSQVSSEKVLRSDVREEHMDVLKTPPMRNMEENQPLQDSSSTNLQSFNSSVHKNNTDPCIVNQIQEYSKVDAKEPATEKHTKIKTLSTTVNSSQTKAGLQESDLFLPPLELESKLNNDILDFDCESICSSKDSLSEDDSKSQSEKSIGYSQNSVETNKSQNSKQVDIVFRRPADCSTECFKSWLGDKNYQVGPDQRGNYGNLPENEPSPTPKKNLITQEKRPGNNMILNRLTSRRNSEIGFSNTKLKRTPYRQSIDSIPANLFSFKIPKLSEVKNSKDIYRNLKHSHQSDISADNITNLLKQNFVNDDNNLKSNNSSKEQLESVFSNINILSNLKIHPPLITEIPQLSGNINSFNQQLINTNFTLKNTQVDCNDVQVQSTYAEKQNQDEYPFNKFPINGIKHVNSKLLNEEKISPVHSVIEMAKFFNITCFPSLVENCPYGTLCPLSHSLRDIDWVRIELRRLNIHEVDILYKFIYKHKILYSYYFNEFCYYYTENRKVNSLCRMLVDFQRYQSFRANKLMIIYNCCLDCGFDKKNACENILKNISRRSSEYLNAVMDIIVESDWTYFVNNVREIISDPNIVLNGSTLKKMAESFINNPDDSILGLFWQCIFKLDAAELQATQGHPAIQMIARKYQLYMTGLKNFN